MPGLSFLAKKSWHTTNLDNVERVWLAEQKAEQEKKKLDELQKQLQEERQIQELRQLQVQSGHKVKTVDTSLDWMYQGPSSEVQKQQSSEEYLLGKIFKPKDTAKVDFKTEEVTDAKWLHKVSSKNDSFTRVHEDPILFIKQEEQKKRNSVINNPIKMDKIRNKIAAELQKAEEEKRAKKALKKEKKEKKKESKKRKREQSDRARDRSNSSSVSEGSDGDRGRGRSAERGAAGAAAERPGSGRTDTAARSRSRSRSIDNKYSNKHQRRDDSRDRPAQSSSSAHYTDLRSATTSDRHRQQSGSSRAYSRGDSRDRHSSSTHVRESTATARSDSRDRSRGSQSYSGSRRMTADSNGVTATTNYNQTTTSRHDDARSRSRSQSPHNDRRHDDRRRQDSPPRRRRGCSDDEDSDGSGRGRSRGGVQQYGLINKKPSARSDGPSSTTASNNSSGGNTSAYLGPNLDLLKRRTEAERREQEERNRPRADVKHLSEEEKQRRREAMQMDANVNDAVRAKRMAEFAARNTSDTAENTGNAKFIDSMRKEVYTASAETGIKGRLDQNKYYRQSTADMEGGGYKKN